jgi:hypothetical protein
MLVPSNSPLPTNSQTPISARRIARGRRHLDRIDRAEKLARFGVLGFCAPPQSFSSLGFNVQSDAYQTPQVVVPNATSSSLVTSSGSGVLDSSPYQAPPQPTVIPINGDGAGVPNDPEHMPLTLQLTRARSSYICPLDREQIPDTAMGESPEWGDSFARPGAPALQPVGGLTQWVKDHPLLAGALALGALALASNKQRNRGRR